MLAISRQNAHAKGQMGSHLENILGFFICNSIIQLNDSTETLQEKKKRYSNHHESPNVFSEYLEVMLKTAIQFHRGKP